MEKTIILKAEECMMDSFKAESGEIYACVNSRGYKFDGKMFYSAKANGIKISFNDKFYTSPFKLAQDVKKALDNNVAVDCLNTFLD